MSWLQKGLKKGEVMQYSDVKELSPAAKRRIREKQERYETILAAALKFFSERGYNKTLIEDIANEAEVSVGTVYFYFKSKEDIMIKLIEDIGVILRKTLGEEFKKGEGNIDGFLNAGRVFFYKVCKKYPEKILLLMRESGCQTPEIEKKRQQLFDRLINDLIKALTKIKERYKIEYKSKMSVEVIATIIMGLFEKISYHFLIKNGTDLEIIGQDVIDFIYGGIKNLVIGDFHDN